MSVSFYKLIDIAYRGFIATLKSYKVPLNKYSKIKRKITYIIQFQLLTEIELYIFLFFIWLKKIVSRTNQHK